MSCTEINEVQAAEFLLDHDNYVILTHAAPDGDTLGSGFALKSALIKAGKNAKVLCPDPIPGKFSYLVTSDENFEEETVIAVDVADEKLLGELKETYGGRITFCIDHHRSNTRYADMLYCESDAAAACECVYKVIGSMNIVIDPYIAGCLYTGLSTDTGCFKFSNTTPRTHRFAAELMQLGADYTGINRVMFEVKSRSRIEMEKQVLENIEFLFGDRCAMLTVTQKMIRETGCDPSDLDGITSMSRQIEGVLIGVTVKEKKDGKYKVSLRTFEPYDASVICSEFGGGGHARAAGCEFDCSLSEVCEKLKAAVGKALGEC